MTVPAKPTTVDEYLAARQGDGRSVLTQLRALSREAVPEAAEILRWGHPAYIHPRGTILFVYSGHARHANFTVTPSTRDAFAEELADYDTGKGSVKLPYAQPVPVGLLRRLIAHRVREFEDDGVLWR
ncbi:iron chaperone [Brachybacterium sp. UNK5269]|uniref:iron chaperone n=1 Tax=Brachybacterium sp. UNK5269 TaxID=3408576 RepID=UPI003BB1AAA9